MRYLNQLIHCNENEEVVEIERYTVQDGMIISLKEVQEVNLQPFEEVRRALEKQGWEISLAGTTPQGRGHRVANSYLARKLLEG